MAATSRWTATAVVLVLVLVLTTQVAASTILATLTMAGPRVVQPATVRFVAVGDQGDSVDAQGVMSNIKSAKPDFFLALGDLNYSTVNDTNKERNWCSMVKGYVNDTEVLSGNHDDGQAAGDNITKIVQYCPFTLGTSTGTYGREYYFDYPQPHPLARFILTSCGLNFQAVDGFNNYFACQNKTTDKHYQFVKNAIDSAHTAKIPWVIVATHMHAVSQSNQSTWVSQDFVNLLAYERVDLFLHGHEHDYQRTSQVTCLPEYVNNFNPACISGVASPYKKGAGMVDVIVGTGGQGTLLDSHTCPYLWWQACRGRMYGFLSVQLTATALAASYVWYRSVDGSGSFTDSFTIGA